MFCNNCNAYIPDGSTYCESCGAPVAATPAVDPGKQQGTTALVLGIVALSLGTICSCLFACLGGLIPLVCAIIGLVLGKSAMSKSQAAGFENKQAKTGMILSIIAIVIIVVFIIANAILGGALAASGAFDYSSFGY